MFRGKLFGGKLYAGTLFGLSGPIVQVVSTLIRKIRRLRFR